MTSKIAITVSRSDRGLPSLNGFRYWWLKEVSGYRYDVHCQACLLGNLDRRFNPHLPVGRRIEVNGPLVYLCGVSNDYSLKKNFHAPAELAVGESFNIWTYNGFCVHFQNARLIPIEPLPDGWHGRSHLFTRCRNFQFAVQMGNREVLADLR